MAKQRRLDRERVVEQAAVMADAAGSVDAVSLTTLAAALEIRVPSLYNHVSGLDDLRAALALYAIAGLLGTIKGAIGRQVGREAMFSLAMAYRAFAQEHPGIYPLTLRAPAADEVQLMAFAQELLQILFLIFASFGIQGDAAVHAVRGLRALMHGFTMLEAVDAFKIPLDLDESYRRLVGAYLAGLA